MTPSPGTTCKFKFISKFELLDGVYRVVSTNTFIDAVSAGVDFVENLYVPAGLQQSDYVADYNGFKSDKVFCLEPVLNRSVVYFVPESIFLNVPDPTIREYFAITLSVNLGVQKDTQTILPLRDDIIDLIRKHLGTTDPVFLSANKNNPIYLTDDEYATLEAERETNKEALQPLSILYEEALRDNTRLAAKVAEYEALIAQSANTFP